MTENELNEVHENLKAIRGNQHILGEKLDIILSKIQIILNNQVAEGHDLSDVQETLKEIQKKIV